MDLASVCTPEMMAPILANAEVQQRLLPFLPSGESLPQSTEEIQNTLSSPQFQQVALISILILKYVSDNVDQTPLTVTVLFSP